MYQAQAYNRMPPGPAPAPGPSKRYPLGNAVNHHAINQYPQQMSAPAPPLPKQPLKAPSSPPLPRQNSKTRPPSPPKVISDKGGRLHYDRVGFLGEGGFARVYEVQDRKGHRLACKVVTKSALKTKKAKTKLYAEIKIHRSLDHPNIVTFLDCFEDEDNVYITLDLCPSGSLMDMLRRRRRFTEPETRFFMVQLIGACHYMHAHQVIHRDLKLGNLFLDANMNIKVGDFGLAALIENPGERKKTICGTPNYIAPEVLFDTANGHSFEVDIWSIGVILYTLVIGRPPFQTREVKEIYKRIRDNEYAFPPERAISSAVKHLIQQILTSNPSERPTLHEIVDHPFFAQGPVPAYIPASAHDGPPDFRQISKSASDANLKRLRRYALVDVEFNNTPAAVQNAAAAARNMTTSIAQQEKEFQKAVQPGSPISALLSSARQPLLVGPSSGGNMNNGGARDSPLLRKLQAVKESPLGRRSVTRTADGGVLVEEDRDRERGLGHNKKRHGLMETDEEEEEMRQRKKELEAQKARIVAQMAPVKEEAELEQEEDMGEEEEPLVLPVFKTAKRSGVERYAREEQENVPPPTTTMGATVRAVGVNSNAQQQQLKRDAGKGKEPERPREPRALGREKENLPFMGSSTSVPLQMGHALASAPAPAQTQAPTPTPKLNGFDAAAQVLTQAFEAKAIGRLFRNPLDDEPLPEEQVFIVSWVDYCNKYGMGYALTDGSVGVHFNDSTSLVLSADKAHFDYIASRRQGTIYVRKSYTVDEYPEELKSKVYLLKHFEKYIMERLYGEYEYTFEDVNRTKGMEWVQKYLRMKHVIVFKLSHDVLQFNFYDHSKLVLSSHGLLVTHIDKHYRMTRWKLTEIMAFALSPPADADAEQIKFNQKLVDKLKYCKEVLVSIKTASAGGGGVGEEGLNEASGAAAAGGVGGGLTTAVSGMPAPSSSTTTLNQGQGGASLNKRASRMALR